MTNTHKQLDEVSVDTKGRMRCKVLKQVWGQLREGKEETQSHPETDSLSVCLESSAFKAHVPAEGAIATDSTSYPAKAAISTLLKPNI